MMCPGCGEHGLLWFVNDNSKRRATVNPLRTYPDGNIVLLTEGGEVRAGVYHQLTVGQEAWLNSTPLFPDDFWIENHDKPRHKLHLAVCTNPKGADARRDHTAHRRP